MSWIGPTQVHDMNRLVTFFLQEHWKQERRKMKSAFFIVAFLAAFAGPAVAQNSAIDLVPAQTLDVLPNFRYRVEPASGTPSVVGASVIFQRHSAGNLVAERTLSDPARQTYTGYELLLEPLGEGGKYLATFRPLSPEST